ncbi:MAG: peroxidase [Gammaproteobacteria bacterium]|nr:MAG: peroxidase [Gammaproteobacteria bacterium]
MPRLKTLSEDATLIDLLQTYPNGAKIVGVAVQEALRGESPLSVQQRELLATYVSGLNQCHYCHGAHHHIAEAVGVDGELLDAVLADPETAPVEATMKPILHYVKKLTLTPSQLTDADADAIRAAGWDDDALHSINLVVAAFSFMNRYVEGAGLNIPPEVFFEKQGAFIAQSSYDLKPTEFDYS